MKTVPKLSVAVLAVVSLVTLCQGLDFRYHNYRNMSLYLRNFTSKHPNLTRLTTIGQSVQGRELLVVEVTSIKHIILGVPNVKLIGNIHGNEAVGREILLHFIEFLVSGYDTDPKIRWLLDNTRVYILPSLNPDGFEMASEGLCAKGMGRENAHNVDLNRSFPDFFKENLRPIQPESEAMQTWMAKIPFILSASLHGGALVANYPFENRREDVSIPSAPSLAPDDDVFRYLSTVYATNHPEMHQGETCPGQSGISFRGGITNGAAWYPITGGMQDYNYIAHGCMEITLEISCCKYPAAKHLPTFWEENKMSLLSYIIQAHRGVRGQILDGITNRPIFNATLRVVGRDIKFFSSTQGEFWRLLLPGEYQLQVTSSENYQPQIVNFTVLSYENRFPEMTTLSIKMYPPGAGPTTTVDDGNLLHMLVSELSISSGGGGGGGELQVSSLSPQQMAFVSTTARSPSEYNDNLSINIHINQVISHSSDPMEQMSVGPAAAVTAGAHGMGTTDAALVVYVRVTVTLFVISCHSMGL